MPPVKLRRFRQATVQQQVYMHPTQTHPAGKSRPVPWINLRGFWLQQAGFEIGTPYTIEVCEQALLLKVIQSP